MKRQRLIILLLVIVLSLTGCSHEEVKIVSGGAALEYSQVSRHKKV